MAKYSSVLVRDAYDEWNSLFRYINELLGTGNEIFDIEAHDDLIFDDDL
jgi:hypothetical protein